ncbi:YfcZ/YiiS family protein [Zophobihabitans entericus]|uniref:DUF406 family protein n=1 Tax=Zophobihabitans entericus TaxID=1635327 RepID=A0A6G9I9R3_9GAMM|nr:YfcZ/YiiS family protein [Zophobihabitans entericus]QIQ20961.1 DUF406 family protein [Zophobihabitans entericus]
MSDSNTLNKCSANETAACCCVDVGTIIDNEDCSSVTERVFASQKEAEAALAKMTELARSVESDPAIIDSKIENSNGQFLLKATVKFSCEAENLIFQLKNR